MQALLATTARETVATGEAARARRVVDASLNLRASRTRSLRTAAYVQEAHKIQSETIDEYDAVYIATTGLIARVADVLGIPY
mgnify:CR=1 FL=1